MAGEVLHVVAGLAAGERIAVGDELIIGRASGGAGRLGDDPEISRRHAMVARTDGGLRIEDLGSTNGTRVNGRRIDGPTALVPGDRIDVGESVLEVRGTQAPVPPSTEHGNGPVPWPGNGAAAPPASEHGGGVTAAAGSSLPAGAAPPPVTGEHASAAPPGTHAPPPPPPVHPPPGPPPPNAPHKYSPPVHPALPPRD